MDALPAGGRGYAYSWGGAARLADALDALAENADTRRSALFELLDQQGVRLHQRLAAAERRVDMAEAQLLDARGQIARLNQQVDTASDRLADELKQRGIIEQISDRHAARLLKRGASNRTASATG